MPLRIQYILGTLGTLWMLVGIGWIVAGAFYLLTALWIVYLWMLFRGRIGGASALARWMALLAAVEGAAYLNVIAGVLVALLTSGVTGSLYRPVVALAFAVAQLVYLHRIAQNA